jgi:hypothetical protein
VPLTSSEHARHDHRAGVHWSALEGVVEVLAMHSYAIDKGGVGRAQRARVSYRSARSVVVACGQRRSSVVLAPRRNGKSYDVEGQVLALGAQGDWQTRCIEHDDALGQSFSD